MSKTFFNLIVAGMMVFFASCNKSDPTDESYVVIEETIDNSLVIKAYNIKNSNSNIVSVKMTIASSKGNQVEYSAKYENDGFELHLPVVPDEYLLPVSEHILSEDIPLNSDIQAKTVSVSIAAYNSEEACIGDFTFKDDKRTIKFVYADRSFTEKGISKYGDIVFDCSYKKGWNIVYWSNEGMNRTTQKSSNESFKCHYLPNFLIKNVNENFTIELLEAENMKPYSVFKNGNITMYQYLLYLCALNVKI